MEFRNNTHHTNTPIWRWQIWGSTKPMTPHLAHCATAQVCQGTRKPVSAAQEILLFLQKLGSWRMLVWWHVSTKNDSYMMQIPSHAGVAKSEIGSQISRMDYRTEIMKRFCWKSHISVAEIHRGQKKNLQKLSDPQHCGNSLVSFLLD